MRDGEIFDAEMRHHLVMQDAVANRGKEGEQGDFDEFHELRPAPERARSRPLDCRQIATAGC
jgi:hypothetical protein